MKRFALFITLMAFHACLSQNFYVTASKAMGDLNKDGIDDVAIVLQDTLRENKPYRLQISFGTGDGNYIPVVSSDKLIEAEYPEGRDGYRYGIAFDGVEIKKGILLVNTSLLRGYITHKFRYQNGSFELIGYSNVESDGIGKIYSEDFNLSTGDRILTEENYETGKMIRNEKTKKLIRPLPKLQDMKAFEDNW